MAQETLNTGANPTGQQGPFGAQNYATSTSGSQFTGGTGNPNVAPPPAAPTTSLAKINPPPSPLAAALPAAGGAAGSYVGGAVGGAVGSAVGGGASIGSAIGSTASNIGNVLKAPIGLGSTPAAAGTASWTPGAVPTSLESSTAGLGVTGQAAGAPLGAVTSDAAAPLAAAPSALGTAGATATAGSTLLGAAGAGLGAGALSELAGAALTPGNFFKNLGKPKVYMPAIESGAGTAIGAEAGAVIGSVILPIGGTAIGAAVGGAVGGGLASLFCHAAGTLIRMDDGTCKPIQHIRIGDKVLLGGAVIGRGEVLGRDLFRYKSTFVNGNHAIFEDGRWLRVRASRSATPFYTESVLLYPLVTENHLLVCEEYICADLAEADEDIGADGRLARLNGDSGRNEWLDREEIDLWPPVRAA